MLFLVVFLHFFFGFARIRFLDTRKGHLKMLRNRNSIFYTEDVRRHFSTSNFQPRLPRKNSSKCKMIFLLKNFDIFNLIDKQRDKLIHFHRLTKFIQFISFFLFVKNFKLLGLSQQDVYEKFPL